MKRLIIATTIALGLVCAGSGSAAQDQMRTTNLQNVTVNAPGQYETYVLDLPMGYGFEAFVGNTHRQYVQAQQAAESSEALRKMGMAPQPYVAVAVDNSTGPGVAKQFQLIDSAQNTVAIVNVYCKRVAPSGGKRCLLAPQSVSLSQRLASI
ncbi:hypothetical protein [Dyella subtropica]|uniref:hypothetical protein n=1 Tax=Dyella subtropica TaxID=2992127 RepID=UPI0022534293|nr:hypothetical protein [Dyella subtropica]